MSTPNSVKLYPPGFPIVDRDDITDPSKVWAWITDNQTGLLRYKRMHLRELSGQFGNPINVKHYGAKGDGATDDTAAIQAAIDAAEVSGNCAHLPAGEYLIDGLDIGAAVEISGPGVLLCAADVDYGIKVQLAWGESTDCTIANQVIGTGSNQQSCTQVASTGHNLTRGQVLKFVADETNPVGGGVGELARVAGVVDANTFNLDRLLEDIQPGDTSISYRAIPDDYIKLDVNFRLTGAEGATGGGTAALVWIDGAVDPQVKIHVERTYNVVCLARSVMGGTIDVVVQDAWDSQDPAVNAYGYGCVLGGATCGTMVNVITQGCRHAFTTANVSGFGYGTAQGTMASLGHPRDCVVSGISHGAYSAAFDTHDGGRRIRFMNCTAISPVVSEYSFSSTAVLPVGFQDRAIDTEFHNCSCIGGRHSFLLSSGDTQPAGQSSSVKMMNCSDQDVSYISIVVGNSNAQNFTLRLSGFVSESVSQVLDLENGTCYANDLVFRGRATRSAFYLHDSRLFASNVTFINPDVSSPPPIYADTGDSVCMISNWTIDRQGASAYPRYLAKADTSTTLELRVGNYTSLGSDLAALIDPGGAGTVTAYLEEQPSLAATASSGDTSPSVLNCGLLKTANAGATTIAHLDNGVEGQKVTVYIGDANTTINFTTGSLRGNAGLNWSPAIGDHMDCTRVGSNWYCDIVDSNIGFGSIYCKDASTAQNTTAATPVKVTGFTTNGPYGGAVTASAASDRLQVTVTGKYLVSFHASCSTPTNKTAEFFVRSGASPAETYIGCKRKFNATGDTSAVSCSGILSLTAGDYIEVWVETLTTTTFTPVHMQLSAVLSSGSGGSSGSVSGSSFNVRDYGATGDGTTDDTSAFLAAIAAANASKTGTILGAIVYVPQGIYKITSTLTLTGSLQLVGDSIRGSVLLFVPTANDTCIEIGTVDQDIFNAVRNIEIRSMTDGYDKIGIHIIDCSQALVDRCYVRFSDVAGSNDDVGICISGRQSTTISDCGIAAPVPIYFRDDAEATVGDSDNCNLENLYLVAQPAPSTLDHACVLVEPTCSLSWITFSGRQAWALGEHAFKWDANVSGSALPTVHLQNVRYEQAEANDTYSFSFNCSSGNPHVVLENCKSAVEQGGLYARNCRVDLIGCTLRRNSASGATADTINIEDANLTSIGTTVSDNGSFDFGSGAQCVYKSQAHATENTTAGQWPLIGIWTYPSASDTAPAFGTQGGVATYSHRFVIPSTRRHRVPVISGNGAIAGIMNVVAWDTSKTVFAAGTFAIWDGDIDGGGRGTKVLSNTSSMTGTPNNPGTLNVWTGSANLSTLYVQNNLGTDIEAFVVVQFHSTTLELGNDYEHTSDIA